MLAKTENDALIKTRVDIVSDRPHAATNYSLQGTKGCYESGRSKDERHKIWLADVCEDSNKWMDLWSLEEYLSEEWRNPSDAMKRQGMVGGTI